MSKIEHYKKQKFIYRGNTYDTDISHPELGIGSPRKSKFDFVAVYPGIVFIKKQKL